MSDRERDVQELCKRVLEIPANYDGEWNSYRSPHYDCPFCGVSTDYYKCKNKNKEPMRLIRHHPSCAYLIAKDLMTGLNQDQ